MARLDGKDRGIVFKEGKWWVRLFVNGREKWYRAENKTQARALYGRLKADIREGTYFPEKYAQSKDVTLRAWILRYLEGSTNRGVGNERRYGRRWSLLLGRRLLNQITTEDLRRIQSRMQAQRIKAQKNPKATKKSKRVWSAATINRHFAFLRHVLMLAVKDGKLDRNPVRGIKIFAEAKRTRYFTDEELSQIQKHMLVDDWKLVAFAIESGLRREEQFSLRWDQVCLETSVITLPLPKGGTTRHIPLSEGAKAILRSFTSFVKSPWVFPSPKDPLKHRNAQTFVNDYFSPALRQVGITGLAGIHSDTPQQVVALWQG